MHNDCIIIKKLGHIMIILDHNLNELQIRLNVLVSLKQLSLILHLTVNHHLTVDCMSSVGHQWLPYS